MYVRDRASSEMPYVKNGTILVDALAINSQAAWPWGKRNDVFLTSIISFYGWSACSTWPYFGVPRLATSRGEMAIAE